MVYKVPPYVSFITEDDEVISLGDEISFSMIGNEEEEIEATLLKASKKVIHVQREDSPCVEIYTVAEIQPNSMKKA
jgi:hypothetical protein